MSQPLYPARVAWPGLGVVYLGFMAMGALFHLVPPILTDVLRDLGLSHGQGGMLMSTFALPGIMLSLSGGWLVDRYGARSTGSLGLLVMGLSAMGLARAEGFPFILVARLMIGVGSALTVVALQRMVTLLFAGRPLGLPVGVAGSAVPVGIIVMYNTAGPLAARAGWRAVPWQAGLITLLITALFLVSARFLFTTGSRAANARPGIAAEGKGEPDAWRLLWVAGLIWFLINGAMTAFLTFAPDHYLALGLGVRERGLITSVPLWASAMLGPLVGLMADRHGGKALFMTAGMALLTCALALVAFDLGPPLLVGLSLGGSLALVVTPLLSLPGELLPPSHHGRGFGIISTCANTGIFLLPPLAGALRDGSAGYFWPFVLLAGVALAGVFAGAALTRLYARRTA